MRAGLNELALTGVIDVDFNPFAGPSVADIFFTVCKTTFELGFFYPAKMNQQSIRAFLVPGSNSDMCEGKVQSTIKMEKIEESRPKMPVSELNKQNAEHGKKPPQIPKPQDFRKSQSNGGSSSSENRCDKAQPVCSVNPSSKKAVMKSNADAYSRFRKQSTEQKCESQIKADKKVPNSKCASVRPPVKRQVTPGPRTSMKKSKLTTGNVKNHDEAEECSVCSSPDPSECDNGEVLGDEVMSEDSDGSNSLDEFIDEDHDSTSESSMESFSDEDSPKCVRKSE